MGSQILVKVNVLIYPLRGALQRAISEVFLIVMVITLLGLAANFFLHEIPLRKSHVPEQIAPQADSK